MTEVCRACTSEFDTEPITLPCGHNFHRRCLGNREYKCPQCPYIFFDLSEYLISLQDQEILSGGYWDQIIGTKFNAQEKINFRCWIVYSLDDMVGTQFDLSEMTLGQLVEKFKEIHSIRNTKIYLDGILVSNNHCLAAISYDP